MASRCSSRGVRAALLVAALGAGTSAAPPEVEPASRLAGIRDEIRRLEQEQEQLARRESGVLVEIERIGTEQRLRAAELEEVTLQLADVEAALASQNRNLESLADAQGRRREYLAFRLREIYRAGPDQALRRFLANPEIERYLAGLRYAALLSERDARLLADFRNDAVRMREEEEALLASRARLGELSTDLGRRQQRLADAQRERERVLRAIRDDRARREAAVRELQQAADELRSFVDSVEPGSAPTVDVRKFTGLLDWPAEGKVSAGFGNIVHPRFKTEVPHPGWDIEGRPGDPIRSVFEGRVVFAAWMRGYGLTAIVDHGSGVMSIYAHASVLLVEAGQAVLRGQELGKIGESGSLRGPYLYFELRVDGQATDPASWLRKRAR